MIRTISDLLLQIQDQESQILEKFSKIKHPSLIGSMYEGLSKKILEQSIFDGLNINVCSGKIQNSKKELSDEVDCMIVIGDGIKIPYTDKYIYRCEQVIAVFQIKKNLFSKEIKDSFANLKNILDVTEFRDGEKFHTAMQYDAYRGICREELPFRNELDSISENNQMIFHTLLLDAFYPARIAWGYNGFKSEFSLRQAFSKFVQDNISSPRKKVTRLSPLTMPNLIICDKYSLVKTNGMPFYHSKINEWWPLIASTSENPLYLLLQVVWTRIQYIFKLPPTIFGDDDLVINKMHGFLHAKFVKTEEKSGWQFYDVDAKPEELKEPIKNSEWEPAFISIAQMVLLHYLINGEEIEYNSIPDLKSYLDKEVINPEALVEELVKIGLISSKDGKIKLLTSSCMCGVLPDGRYYAGENNTGTVEKWVKIFMESWKAKKLQPDSDI